MKTIKMNKRDQILISCFIIVYWTIVLIEVSSNCPLKHFVRQYTRGIEILLGIDQSWRMFCPNPRDYNFHPYALITFADGSTAFYEFPRPDKMNQLDALLRERLRKHFYDILPWDDYKIFRPSVARYIARSFYNPKNQPVRICLCYNDVPLGRIPKIIPRENLPVGTARKTYFIYQVSPEDFK